MQARKRRLILGPLLIEFMERAPPVPVLPQALLLKMPGYLRRVHPRVVRAGIGIPEVERLTLVNRPETVSLGEGHERLVVRRVQLGDRPRPPRPLDRSIEPRALPELPEDLERVLRGQQRERRAVRPFTYLRYGHDRVGAGWVAEVSDPARADPVRLLAGIGTAQGNHRVVGPSLGDGEEGYRVPMLRLIEHPSPSIQEKREILELTVLEQLQPEELRALRRENGAGQDHAHVSAGRRKEIPEPPREGFVEVGVAGSHAWEGTSDQRAAQELRRGHLAVERPDQIRSPLSELRSQFLALALLEPLEPRHVAAPEPVLLNPDLLPRGVPQNDIEPRALAQEDLGERDREMERRNGLEKLLRPPVELAVRQA